MQIQIQTVIINTLGPRSKISKRWKRRKSKIYRGKPKAGILIKEN